MAVRLFFTPLRALDYAACHLDGRLLVLVAWAVLIYPAIALRGFHYEEGLAVAIARGAIHEGHWFEPHIYGIRFVERPNLLAVVVAGLGMITGGLHPLVVRLPTACALLLGCLLVYRFVESRTSRTAGLVAAACFLLCPMLLQKHVTAEPDLALTVLLFWAFVIWWNGQEGDGPTLGRWCAIGTVLAVAALLKGPQPLAYFALGTGAFLVINQQWRQAPGFVLSGVIAAAPTALWYAAIFQPGDASEWARYMRVGARPDLSALVMGKLRFGLKLFLELLPGSVAALAFAIWGSERHHRLTLALGLYAGACTLVLLLWPSGVSPRYAMPAAPAVAALAGLAFDQWQRYEKASAGLLWIASAFSLYALAASWIVAPAAPWIAQHTRIAAYAVDGAVQTAPGTIFGVFRDGHNVLAHVDAPIRFLPSSDFLKQLPAGSWVLARPADLAAITDARPDVTVVRHVHVPTKDVEGGLELARLVPQPRTSVTARSGPAFRRN